jgi:DNA-directed RNA polymerase subunit RPC12/RpoP
MTPATHLRRILYRDRRLAWLMLAASIAAVVLWELLGGPHPGAPSHPEGFGYRFSPMYTFSLQGIVSWGLVAFMLVSLGLLHWFYLGRELSIRCPRCEARESSKVDWICPDCSKENHPAHGGALNILYTVLTRCRHCGKSPEAWRCAQCGNVVDLQENADRARYARSPNTQP